MPDYIKGVTNSTSGFPTNLDRQKIAVVYNSNATHEVESLAMADYYVAARGLNPALIVGYDFGTSAAISAGNYQTGSFFTGIITDFAAFCVTNSVQAVILSIKTMDKVSIPAGGEVLDDGNGGKGSVCVTMAACHHFVEQGGITITNRSWVTNAAGTPNPVPFDTGLAGYYNAYDDMDYVFYNDVVTNGPLGLLDVGLAHRYGRFPNLDYRLGERPYSDSQPTQYNLMPSGRIGHPDTNVFATRGWTDSFDETKRLIDDAIFAEQRGYAANKNLPIVNLVLVRGGGAEALNVHSTSIPAHVLRGLGWDVTTCSKSESDTAELVDGAGNSALDNNIDAATTAGEVLDLYNVLRDHTMQDFEEGLLPSPLPVFCSMGTGLANQDDHVWISSVAPVRGWWHMTSTSFPSRTLGSAITAGACAGIAGDIEPLSSAAMFLGEVYSSVLLGRSLMEGMHSANYNFFRVNQFAAGDPLYAPYKRSSLKTSIQSGDIL